MADRMLLGDEAVAQAALDAGIAGAYAYPGTPSTEILAYLQRQCPPGGPAVAWTANEKTACESALGVAFAGRRALVAMKHVGLNVAADPFINAALVAPHGGLVIVVADDPGMHSSQNEQDTRFFADLARVPLLEPADEQQAYDLTREAFDVSERLRVPVVVRLVTRLAHARGAVRTREPRVPAPIARPADRASWILLPTNARRQWRALLDRQPAIAAWSETCGVNTLTLGARGGPGIITAGVAANYFREWEPELDVRPSHLHIGAYPVPRTLVRRLVEHAGRVLVLEDGQPFIERRLTGLLGAPIPVSGRLDGTLPEDGELTPDIVRRALGLPALPTMEPAAIALPERPPQLCAGCPHADSFAALTLALEGLPNAVVTSDIGCYTLGALPPWSIIESCVCMGASIGMARGTADAGARPVVAVIGDSTFLHSGATALMDAVAADADMTLLILDNETVAMTGGQPTVLPSSRLQPLLLGIGVRPEHCRVVPAHPRRVRELGAIIREEIEHPGLSVVIAVRECVETARAHKAAAAKCEPLAAERA